MLTHTYNFESLRAIKPIASLPMIYLQPVAWLDGFQDPGQQGIYKNNNRCLASWAFCVDVNEIAFYAKA